MRCKTDCFGPFAHSGCSVQPEVVLFIREVMFFGFRLGYFAGFFSYEK